MTYIICYDVANPKRLRLTAKALEDFGIRIQKSVFHCEMKKPDMERLKRTLLQQLHLKEDSLFIYPMCSDCLRLAQKDGTGVLLEYKSYEIL